MANRRFISVGVTLLEGGAFWPLPLPKEAWTNASSFGLMNVAVTVAVPTAELAWTTLDLL